MQGSNWTGRDAYPACGTVAVGEAGAADVVMVACMGGEDVAVVMVAVAVVVACVGGEAAASEAAFAASSACHVRRKASSAVNRRHRLSQQGRHVCE